jgi:fibronectin type 3 domain-containing protein
MIGDKRYIGLILFVLMFIFSCSRQIPDPVSPPKNDFIPATPANVTANVGDRLVALTWSVPDTQGIRFYRVYMAVSDSAAYTLLSEVNETHYTAANLQNGRTYHFKISSVSHTRFEGYSSAPMAAVPDLFAIVANDGEEFTNSRQITLSLVAPTGTQYMQISNDSTFAGAIWEHFLLTKSWELPSGDMTRVIYAKFRDSSDQVTADHYSDSITLDTEATIDSINFAPAGVPFASGDRVHFRLFANESDGQARITIGQTLASIILYDDGTRGDVAANDGIYEINYFIAANLDFENTPVYGNFTDRATNSAQQVQSRINMSVRRAPDPVSIYGITGISDFYDRLELNWNRSNASDFAQYKVYRSLTPGVDSTDILVSTLSSISTNSLIDTGLAANTTYYYKLYVIDNTGLWAGSNEVHANTFTNIPPNPVTIYPVVADPGTHDRLSLTWSACNDQDFLRYELFRSMDATVDTSDLLILVSSTETAYTDTGLTSTTTYYYRVMALDRAGNRSWSNIVSGRTGVDNPPPSAVILPLNPEPDNYQSIDIRWNQPDLNDFQSYRLYSWRGDNNRTDSVLLAIITNLDSVSFMDHPAFDTGIDTVNYWYIVYTIDNGRNAAASNALRVHLVDDAPGSADGIVVSDSAIFTISWTNNNIPDFGSYRLLRDTLSSPNQAVVVFAGFDQGVTTYSDRNVAGGLTYYYWLEIFDRRGHHSQTFLGSARW